MELNEDLVVDIICRLPVKLAIQCKILCKSINYTLCEPKVIQSFALQDENICKQLIYSSSSSKYKTSKVFCNVSIDRSRCEISKSSPLDMSVLASCKGLLFLEFHEAGTFCIFNPITGAHQLIPYPEPRKKIIEGRGEGLVVDYPNSGLYKLVTVRKLDEQLGYIFHVFSSGELWHEFQLGPKFGYASLVGQPAYVHDCLHWLRIDGTVLVFDTRRGYEARIINFPEVIKSYVKDPLYGIISFLFDAWLGTTQGVLTLVCAFKKLIVIFNYDYVRSNWTVSHTLANFSPDLGCLGHGFPMWFDGEKLLFLVRHSSASKSGYLYEYDSEMKTYEKVHVILDMDTINHFFSFEPTLANVVTKSTVLPYTERLRAITTALAKLRCLITKIPRVECDIGRAVNKFPYIN